MKETSAPEAGISVIVCTKDRVERVQSLLAALDKQTVVPDEVVVVDASDPPLKRDRLSPRARLVRDDGRGLAAARNQGAIAAKQPLVLYLDDDVMPPADLVERILRAHADHPEAAAVGAVPVEKRSPSRMRVFFLRAFQRGPFFFAIGVAQRLGMTGAMPVHRLSTSAMSLRRDLLLRHPFDENLIGASVGEDADLSLRLAREHPVLLIADLLMPHQGIGWGSRPLASKFEQKVYSYAYLYYKNLRGQKRAGRRFAWLLVGIFTESVVYGARHVTLQPVRAVVRALLRLRSGLDGAGGFIDKDPRSFARDLASSRTEPTVRDGVP